MVQLQLKEWLSVDDFPKNGILKVTFQDEGEFTKGTFDGKEVDQFEIGVMLPAGEVKKWTMNKTSQRAVAEHYGADTGKWVKQTAELFLMDQNVSGKIKKVIYARGKQ
jgi:hypothetical protein